MQWSARKKYDSKNQGCKLRYQQCKNCKNKLQTPFYRANGSNIQRKKKKKTKNQKSLTQQQTTAMSTPAAPTTKIKQRPYPFRV